MIARDSKMLHIALLMFFSANILQCSPKPQGISVEMPGQGNANFSQVPTPEGSGNSTGPNRCELLASPTQVAAGGTVQLSSFIHGDVKTISVDNKPMTIPTGILTVTPQATTEYRAVGIRASGEEVYCVVTVTVIGGTSTDPTNPTNPTTPTGPLPTCVLTADKASILSGEATTIKMNAPADATNIILDGTAIQNNGQKFVQPPSTQTYTGTFSSPNGNNSCQTTITVTQSSNPNGGSGNLPSLRTTVKSCSAYSQQLGLGTCTVNCPRGWIMKDSAAIPESGSTRNGGRCDLGGLSNGSQGVICYGGSNIMFTGYYKNCTCKIACEGY